MFDLVKLQAIGMMIAKQAREKAESNPTAANDIIDMAPLLRKWSEGEWKKDEVCVYNDLPYWCIQAHNSTNNPTWSPGYDTALWALYHGRDAMHALTLKIEGHNPYNKGHWMIWIDGNRYCSKQDGNVWTPVDLPSGWDGPFDEHGNRI